MLKLGKARRCFSCFRQVPTFRKHIQDSAAGNERIGLVLDTVLLAVSAGWTGGQAPSAATTPRCCRDQRLAVANRPRQLLDRILLQVERLERGEAWARISGGPCIVERDHEGTPKVAKVHFYGGAESLFDFGCCREGRMNTENVFCSRTWKKVESCTHSVEAWTMLAGLSIGWSTAASCHGTRSSWEAGKTGRFSNIHCCSKELLRGCCDRRTTCEVMVFAERSRNLRET